MNQKTVVYMILGTAMGLVVVLFWSLSAWSAQAAATTRYVALQSACGSQSPCYPDIQSALGDSDAGDEILVAGGTYTGVQRVYPIIGAGNVFTQGVFIDKDITIKGGYTTTTWAFPDPVANPTIIDALELGRVVYITNGVTVTLEGLSLVNGRAFQTYPEYTISGGGVFINAANVTISNCKIMSSTGSMGAGISNAGVLTLTNSMIAENYGSSPAPWNWGGGISNSGILNIYASTIMSNSADIAGGIGNYGKLKIISSTLSYNQAPNIGRGSGGAIQNLEEAELIDSAILNNTSLLGGGIKNSGSMTITNSTISQNWSSSHGVGGIANTGGALTITNATIVSNTETVSDFRLGIGIRNDESGGSISISNSIIAYHPDGNCDGAITSLGHNIEDMNTCGLTVTGDLSNTNPMLDELAYYDGPTLSFGLLPASLAIDAGDNAVCPPTDQRGVGRPVDGNDDGIANCDIGSFEYEAAPPTPEPTPIPPSPSIYTFLPLLSR